MKKLFLVKLLVTLLLLISFIPLANIKGQTNDVSIVHEFSLAKKDWTVLVYMCGDNNLEYAAITDMNELENGGGTTADVNVLAMIDRSEVDYEVPYYAEDWSDARYFQVMHDYHSSTIDSPVNSTLGEVNMGDSQTLRNFINWGLTNYPANNTALILWDHGGGLDGVCWDDDSGDFLTINEVRIALDGYHFDLIGFDACVMGQFEVLYELKESCDIFVASMYNVPFDGLPYNFILSELIIDPSMTAAEWADVICFEYVDFYKFSGYDVTMSAYNTSALENIEAQIDSLSNVLITYQPTYPDEFFNARMNSISVHPDLICDFYEFLDNLLIIGEPAISSAVTNVKSILDDALVTSYSTLTIDPYGMWIFLPLLPYEYSNDFYIFSNQTVVNSYPNIYYDFDFVANTSWDNFLYQWKTALESYIPTVPVSGDYSGSLLDGEFIYLQADLPVPTPGYAYLVTLTMDTFVDFDLAVWNDESYWGLPSAVSAGSYEGTGIPEEILIPVSVSTTVFFYVESYTGTGSYTLTLSLTEYYDDIYEENDDLLEAAPLELNILYDLIASDIDVFFIDLLLGQPIEISLDFDTGAIDLDLYLLDDMGNLIDSSEEYFSTEHISYTAEYSGLYYIVVNPFSGDLGSEYSLIISSEMEPSIYSINYSPADPEDEEEIEVTCSVSSFYSLDTVILSYSVDFGLWINITMSLSGGVYGAIIPSNAGAERVDFKIYATDTEGNYEISRILSVLYSSSTLTDFPWMILPAMFFVLAIIKINKKRRKQ